MISQLVNIKGLSEFFMSSCDDTLLISGTGKAPNPIQDMIDEENEKDKKDNTLGLPMKGRRESLQLSEAEKAKED